MNDFKAILLFGVILLISIIVADTINESNKRNAINQETIQRIDSLEQQIIYLKNEVTELENQIDYLYH